MAVYFFTLHAYRSWPPDHRRGYVRRDEGILPPDPEMAELYDELAGQEPVEFSKAMQDVMIAGAYDICRETQLEIARCCIRIEPSSPARELARISGVAGSASQAEESSKPVPRSNAWRTRHKLVQRRRQPKTCS